ncbi:hypothetical protein CEXT_715611 [Caerostris extrusa]|uniref:Uncharacterized protein n=1 Tax=Caerostris extrusa TaxID=172846 RepID=A0AAV4MLS2_CAEEX|nr:hypothetical protein CEXT_715611 [Caerostris extrusa]
MCMKISQADWLEFSGFLDKKKDDSFSVISHPHQLENLSAETVDSIRWYFYEDRTQTLNRFDSIDDKMMNL